LKLRKRSKCSPVYYPAIIIQISENARSKLGSFRIAVDEPDLFGKMKLFSTKRICIFGFVG